jgi:hypothetical protein
MADIKVALINSSTVVSDGEVQEAMAALQTQVHRDFGPTWGIDADLVFVPPGSDPPSGAWWLVILDTSDQAGALGYHDLTSQGLPLGKVFAKSDIDNGYIWTVTASHELLEELLDPDIALATLVEQPQQNGVGSGVLYAYEVCDACEADQYGYKIDVTTVSDFVYPAWFESFWPPGSTQFDHQNQIQRPFELLPGGYIGIYPISSGGGWQQLTAQATEAALHWARPRVGSRRERRRTARSQWQPSTAHAAVGRSISAGPLRRRP